MGQVGERYFRRDYCNLSRDGRVVNSVVFGQTLYLVSVDVFGSCSVDPLSGLPFDKCASLAAELREGVVSLFIENRVGAKGSGRRKQLLLARIPRR